MSADGGRIGAVAKALREIELRQSDSPAPLTSAREAIRVREAERLIAAIDALRQYDMDEATRGYRVSDSELAGLEAHADGVRQGREEILAALRAWTEYIGGG